DGRRDFHVTGVQTCALPISVLTLLRTLRYLAAFPETAGAQRRVNCPRPSKMANLLANIFGSSPVMPLEKHCDIAYRCTRELVGFFEAAIAGNWEEAQAIRDTIEELEHEADDLKKEIRLHLPKSLFMPVPREDLLELLLVQDKMANRTKDVSGLVLGRKMSIPSEISGKFLEF